MPEQEFSPMESLQLIRNMISKTKQGMYDRSSYFLLWGWGTFIAATAQYILKVVFDYPYHYRVWWLVVLYVILSFSITRRHKRKEQSKTYIQEAVGYLWFGIGMSFFVLAFVFSKIGWQYCYPVYMMLYGLGTFVSGNLTKFKPLIIGGIISWFLAAVSVWFNYDQQILFASAALLASYIIPGHMLRAQYQRDRKNYLTTA